MWIRRKDTTGAPAIDFLRLKAEDTLFEIKKKWKI
jgi:hypothetical protein